MPASPGDLAISPVLEGKPEIRPQLQRPDLAIRPSHPKPKEVPYWDGLYADRLVVKVSDALDLFSSASDPIKPVFAPRRAVVSEPGGSRAIAVARELTVLNQLLQSDRVTSVERLFTAHPEQLQRWRAIGEARTGKRLAHLENYLLVRFAKEQDRETANILQGLGIVETVYFPPIPADADLPPTTESFDADQGYLDPAPRGIDARFAWTLPGGRGEGMRIVDIEAGWNLDHEDLPPPFTGPGLAINTPGLDLDGDGEPDNSHGTAVLGEVVGLNNGTGVTGIAADARFGIVSVIRFGALGGSLDGTTGIHDASVADAIVTAIALVQPGDVILIEQHSPGPPTNNPCSACGDQNFYVPMEFYPASFDAIQLATSNGIVVVEAAGNGGQRLDQPEYGGRFDRSTRDSGAIMVAGSDGDARRRNRSSNHGTRIDVHGWGSDVMTTGYGRIRANGDDQNQFYTDAFSGTSSASPIVAGAVLALQGILRASDRDPLTPLQMRELLASTGTPQSPGPERIGPLPDLAVAIPQLDGAIASIPSGEIGGSSSDFSLMCPTGFALAGIQGAAEIFVDRLVAVCRNAAGAVATLGPVGGTGGRVFSRLCAEGSAVTALDGRREIWVDSLTVSCGAVDGSSDGGALSPIGGSGGSAFSAGGCDAGRLAVGLGVDAGWFVDDVTLRCAEVVLDATPPVFFATDAVGGSGGTDSANLRCRQDEVMVGFRVREGRWIDAIAPRCMRVDPATGAWVPDTLHGFNLRGGAEGTLTTRMCPENSAITGFRGRSGSFVDRLVAECTPLESGEAVSGGRELLDRVGGDGGDAFLPIRCTGSLPATGLRVTFGSAVDSLSMECGRR